MFMAARIHIVIVWDITPCIQGHCKPMEGPYLWYYLSETLQFSLKLEQKVFILTKAKRIGRDYKHTI